MKYQSFIMRILCLILIAGAVIGYNSMQKDNSDTELTQEISSLTKRVETLEEQQEEMLSALEDAAKAQEEAKKKAEEEAKKADKDEESTTAEEKEDAEENEETKESEEAEDTEDSDPAEEEEDLVYKNGTYTGEGQGFGGTIQVQVTLEDDTITDIQVVSAPGEDSAYLSQGEGVISSILSAQSTDVDTISGATFSSTGIINAVIDALGKAENE